jgi:hypothetical protein
MATYEYELTKRRELDYDYMLACKKCLQLENDFPNYCEFQDLRTAIAEKLRAKQAYELQEKVVKFALYENKAFLDAKLKFREDIKEKIAADPSF